MASIPTIRDCQERLIALGYNVGPTGADNLGGKRTQAAILQFQADHGLPKSGQFDQATVNLLFSLRVPNAAAQAVVLSIISFIVNQTLLKGTGINMDFAKISKAVAGGITAAIATTGTMAIVYLQLPPESQAHFPSFVYSALPWINEVIGFLVGFCGVYFAPANKAPQ